MKREVRKEEKIDNKEGENQEGGGCGKPKREGRIDKRKEQKEEQE